MRVLIIEDEVRLAENVATALREGSGYAVDHAANGLDGEMLAQNGCYDAVVLDLMLPGQSGEQVLKSMRAHRLTTPVLVLTARGGPVSTVELLNSGADDYLSKPFDLGELVARVKALVRRGKGSAHSVLSVGELELNTIEQTVYRGGRPIELTSREYRILEYLMHRPRAVVSQKELLEHLYDYNWEHHSNVIEAHISKLRRKLDPTGEKPAIETLRHRGYRLNREGKSA